MITAPTITGLSAKQTDSPLLGLGYSTALTVDVNKLNSACFIKGFRGY